MQAAPSPDLCRAVDTLAALVGLALRSKGRNVRIYPLEPANSPTLRTGRKVGSHRIQGISDEFIPGIVKLDQLDAIVVGAMKLVEELGPEATVVTVLCDSNKKYLSTALPQAEPPQDDYMTPKVQLQSFISVR